MARGIYVETPISASLDVVWSLTQDPEQHVRWDVRFSRIVPTGTTESGATRFTYTRRVLFRTVAGDGVSLGETGGRDGSRTSALRFATSDPVSPIRSGRGYWRYVPDGDGVRFVTGYDYTPGWGAPWTVSRAPRWAGPRRGASTACASGPSGTNHPSGGRS